MEIHEIVFEQAERIKDKYPDLTTYESLDLAIKYVQLLKFSEAHVLGAQPSALEAIVMELRKKD